ncbi:uncharacterized protein LOC108674253 [Hyalella azteca]|uniref:Uncharacterized protein LOC108674253 n=1 Tax=Hyalella azteca TaxID=294128 RepID=A0A8B7NV84_HYAAZ|nr:uncharacterized protein LOC108674253 [Hyalella azteca]
MKFLLWISYTLTIAVAERINKIWQPSRCDTSALAADASLAKNSSVIEDRMQCLAWATLGQAALVCYEAPRCSWWQTRGVAVGVAVISHSASPCFMSRPFPVTQYSSCAAMPGFVLTSIGCLLFDSVARTFTDARDFCLQRGSDLFTMEQDSQLAGLITYLNSFSPRPEVWMGLRKMDGKWYWLTMRPYNANNFVNDFSDLPTEFCLRFNTNDIMRDCVCDSTTTFSVLCLAKNFK